MLTPWNAGPGERMGDEGTYDPREDRPDPVVTCDRCHVTIGWGRWSVAGLGTFCGERCALAAYEAVTHGEPVGLTQDRED